MSLILSETLVLAKTRSQDLKSVVNFNCWGSGIKDVSLVRQLINVEVIGFSCNEITTLEDFAYCPKLKELILRKNKIKNISEVAHLQNLPKLTNLWLGENPCAENTHNYRKVVLKALPNLTMLDNIPVTKDELREIEELGNDIYEEVQYETNSNSSGSGPSSSSNNFQEQQQNQQLANSRQFSNQLSQNNEQQQFDYHQQQNHHDTIVDHYNNINLSDNLRDQDINDHASHVNSNQSFLNDSNYPSTYRLAHNNSRTSHSQSISNHHQPQSKCLSLQGSVTTLNGTGANQNQSWNYNNNNTTTNNNVIPPRGGKSHTGNILSAVLCLVKELDYTSCEVVQTALNCRMEETS